MLLELRSRPAVGLSKLVHIYFLTKIPQWSFSISNKKSSGLLKHYCLLSVIFTLRRVQRTLRVTRMMVTNRTRLGSTPPSTPVWPRYPKTNSSGSNGSPSPDKCTEWSFGKPNKPGRPMTMGKRRYIILPFCSTFRIRFLSEFKIQRLFWIVQIVEIPL